MSEFITRDKESKPGPKALPPELKMSATYRMLMTEEEKSRLARIAEVRGVTMGEFLRGAINTMFTRMEKNGQFDED